MEKRSVWTEMCASLLGDAWQMKTMCVLKSSQNGIWMVWKTVFCHSIKKKRKRKKKGNCNFLSHNSDCQNCEFISHNCEFISCYSEFISHNSEKNLNCERKKSRNYLYLFIIIQWRKQASIGWNLILKKKNWSLCALHKLRNFLWNLLILTAQNLKTLTWATSINFSRLKIGAKICAKVV